MCIYTPQMLGQNRESEPLVLQLKIVVSNHVDAWNKRGHLEEQTVLFLNVCT